MAYYLKFFIFCSLLSSCIGNCRTWGDAALKTYNNVKTLYNSDSAIFITIEQYLNDQLKHPIDESKDFTWDKDSLRQNSTYSKLLFFFNKNHIKLGKIVDSNKVYFYYDDNDNILNYNTCDTLNYLLVYLKDDNIPIYSGNKIHLNERIKWYKIAKNWYLQAFINK